MSKYVSDLRSHHPKRTFHTKSLHVSPKHSFYDECCADAAIETGNFKDAKEYLLAAVDGTTRHSRSTRALAKLITLPFAEIRHTLHEKRTPVDDELLESADGVYGLLGEAMEIKIKELGNTHSDYDASQHVGIISELSVLGLGARRFCRNRRSVIISSSVNADYEGVGRAVDAVGYNLEVPSAVSRWLQIKTTGFHDKLVATTVVPIVVGDLLPYRCTSPLDARSLPNLMIAELGATSAEHATVALDYAEKELHKQIFGTHANR